MVLSQNGIICSWNVFWRRIIIVVNVEALCANQGDIFGVVSRSENFRIDVVPRWFGWSGSLGRIGSLEELSRISFGNYIDIPDGTVYLASLVLQVVKEDSDVTLPPASNWGRRSVAA